MRKMGKEKPYVKLSGRIFNHVGRILEVNHEAMPATLEIHLTNMCNNTCTFCFYKSDLDDDSKKRFLSETVVLETVREFASGGGGAIVLSGGREPTLHPHFPEIVDEILSHGLDVGIITNGIRSTDRIEQALLKTTWVKISLHAGSEDDYRRQTNGSPHYKKILRNIARLVQHKSDKTKISVGCVISRLNQCDSEIMRYFNAAAELAVDYVLFRPYMGDDSDLVITRKPDDFSVIGNTIKERSEAEGVYTNFGSFVKDIGRKRTYQKPGYPVVEAGLLALINSQGDLYLCLPTATSGHNAPIGSILRASFNSLWRSEQRKQIIGDMSGLKCPACKYEKMFPLVEQIRGGYVPSPLKKDVHWKFL